MSEHNDDGHDDHDDHEAFLNWIAEHDDLALRVKDPDTPPEEREIPDGLKEMWENDT